MFFTLRFLYGVGMGGNWGVGASLGDGIGAGKVAWILVGPVSSGLLGGQPAPGACILHDLPHVGLETHVFRRSHPAVLTLFLCLKIKEPEAWREARTDWGTYRGAVFAIPACSCTWSV